MVLSILLILLSLSAHSAPSEDCSDGLLQMRVKVLRFFATPQPPPLRELDALFVVPYAQAWKAKLLKLVGPSYTPVYTKYKIPGDIRVYLKEHLAEERAKEIIPLLIVRVNKAVLFIPVLQFEPDFNRITILRVDDKNRIETTELYDDPRVGFALASFVKPSSNHGPARPQSKFLQRTFVEPELSGRVLGMVRAEITGFNL